MCADCKLLFAIFFGGKELSIAWYDMLSLNMKSFYCQVLKVKLGALFQPRENTLPLMAAILSAKDHTRYKEKLINYELWGY